MLTTVQDAPHSEVSLLSSANPRRCGSSADARTARAPAWRVAGLLALLSAVHVGGAAAASLSLLSAPEDPFLLGSQADRSVNSCDLDATGRAVFASDATQLVANDHNGESDVFLKNLVGGAIGRLSRHADAGENPESTSAASISDDGVFVAFVSEADLVGSGAPGEQQVYLVDRGQGSITLISRSTAGVAGNARSSGPQIDATGAFVVFSSEADNLVAGDANLVSDVFRYDIAADTVLRVSTDSLGNEGNDHSSAAQQVAAGGNVVAFASRASNLVAGDGNGVQDVFAKDLTTGTTERISVDVGGGDADALSTLHAISENGDVVAFVSSATNLVGGDSNGLGDVFVRRRSVGLTLRVSVDASGAQGDGASRQGRLADNGHLVAFISAANNLDGANPSGVDQIYLKDMLTGAVTRLTNASIGILNVFDFSADGARICFNGGDETLVAGDSNRVGDLYTIDVATQAVARINLAANAHPVTAGNDFSMAPDISDDGRYAVFDSGAALLDAERFASAVAHSSGFHQDIYLRDNTTGAIDRLSNDPGGGGGDNSSQAPAISGDGRFVAFESHAGNLIGSGDGNDDADVFRVDTSSGALIRISEALSGDAGRGRDVSISDAGDTIAFVSVGDDLVANDVNGEQDVFVWNVVDGIRRVSVSAAGIEADEDSSSPQVSGDGNVVVFASGAANLVAADSNGHDDIFVHDLATGAIERVSIASDGTEANADSQSPVVSRDGRHVAFASAATNLVPGDLDPGSEIVLVDRLDGSVRSASADLASLGLLEPEQPWLSPDGRVVLYRAVDIQGFRHLLHYDRDTGHLRRLQAGDPDGNTDSQAPAGYAASADARMIVFDWVDHLLVADNNDPDSDSDIYALQLTPGALGLPAAQGEINEDAGSAVVSVRRIGGSDGLVRVDYATLPGSATAGDDYTAVSGSLTWPDGDDATQLFSVPIIDDDLDDDDETLIVRLTNPLGGADLGIAATTLTIRDDDDDGAADRIFTDGFE